MHKNTKASINIHFQRYISYAFKYLLPLRPSKNKKKNRVVYSSLNNGLS